MGNVRSAAALCAFLLSTPALAQDRFDPVQASVLPGWVLSDGSRMVALDMQLAPGWKTYWRAPGDAGIPPTFDWSRSDNLYSVAVSWPAPRVFDQNGMRSYGYEERLILPLKIVARQPDAPVTLSVTVDMGVCSDVCVPYQMTLSSRIDGTATAPTPAIAAALAAQPFSAREAGVQAATCRVEPISDGLRLEARLSMPVAGSNEVVVFEPGVQDVWVSEAETRREGGDVIASSDLVHVSGKPFAINRSDIRITVLSDRHAVDIRGCSSD